MIRPPVEGLVAELGWVEADFRREGSVALRVLKEPSVSISSTVRKALEERPESGAIKFPAAPALLNRVFN